METNYYPRPSNFVAEINGHLIVRRDESRCDIWTADVGFWAFGLDEAEARRLCEIVTAYAPKSAVQSPTPPADRRS